MRSWSSRFRIHRCGDRPRRGQPAYRSPHEAPDPATESMEAQGEWLALAALLLPWGILSLLLPLPHLVAALGLLTALAALLTVAVRWSRMRASRLKLDAEAWGLATVLTLGFSMALLLGAEGKSPFQVMCGDCGKLSDARAPFCYGCGSYGA